MKTIKFFVFFILIAVRSVAQNGGDRISVYPGDIDALQKNLALNLKYPKTSNPKKGVVTVEIWIDKNGDITRPKVLRSLRKDYDSAAVAAVKKLGRFQPALKNGTAVAQDWLIPVKFK